MKRILAYAVILICHVLVGCSTIYEYPEPPGVDPTAIDFRLTVAVDFTQPYDTTWTVTKSSGQIPDGCVPRIIVEAYVDDYPSSSEISAKLYKSEPYIRKIVPVSNTEEGQQRITTDLKLKPQPYIFIVWADYSDGDINNDLYHYTERLYSICLTDAYQANTTARDAFWAMQKLDLSPYKGEWFREIEKDIFLTRATARYEIITQDIEKFISTKKKERALTGDDIWDVLKDYHVIIRHVGFYPTEFDGSTGKLTDAAHGITFKGNIRPLEGNSAIIAFDYLLSEHAESAVTVDIEIYNNEGKSVQHIPSVRIPFKRNVTTRVYGDFLTMKFDPSIGINAEYDGEFNIYL